MPLYDGFIGCPKEGELYRRCQRVFKGNQPIPVWSIDIDKSKGAKTRGLRLLWDAS